jgi:hypothetical protein
LRERNVLLLAAGYAPAYTETPLDAEVMAPARAALDAVLGGHHPFPAVIVDGRWNLLSANEPALALLTEDVAPELLEPPVNAMRVSLHPEGLAPHIANLPEYGEHLLVRVQRQAVLSGDPELGALAVEMAGYLGVESVTPAVEPADLLFVPLSFFSTLASFGTALDITLAELAIEAFFPSDDATRDALRDRFG